MQDIPHSVKMPISPLTHLLTLFRTPSTHTMCQAFSQVPSLEASNAQTAGPTSAGKLASERPLRRPLLRGSRGPALPAAPPAQAPACQPTTRTSSSDPQMCPILCSLQPCQCLKRAAHTLLPSTPAISEPMALSQGDLLWCPGLHAWTLPRSTDHKCHKLFFL